MRKRISVIISVGIFLCLALSPGNALAQYNSSKNPAPIGSPVKSMVELGSVYSSIYDITITVLETVRGKDAMKRLDKAPEPPEGFEYILARVKFEMKARAVSDKLTFDLGDSPLQWTALASDLTEYPRVSATPPAPQLKGTVKPGASVEGWVSFAVDIGDSGPVMVFDPDSGGATGRGKTLFFKMSGDK